MAKSNIVFRSYRLNLDNEQQRRVNKVLAELNTDIHKSVNQFITDAIDFCHMEEGRLVPQNMLTVIYDRADKEYLYDAEENFVDTVHEWLDGQCTPEQLEQEPCEVKGTREEVLHGKGIQTGGSGRNPCGDGTACRSAGRHYGKR